ncbi:MAG: ferritin [Dehalococcoidia bacterium]|jgi:ferritin|uniref:ferritin n=1 Tax=Candidatus Amarobacter glycogenicus TaxID=3140699 RepID=UPI001D524B5F|nr:ferritin [Dehalococcoidia bacterium]MBK6562429.1 ferritin [Dehalococcoidia bacterium]MBK7124381.1 ferritin [Dehalococcoidia bacterium]MBK7328266.1 ferritin [Dehalococcoidia bacterium]MBK7724069.1 ferritin [Dehalococcoidia bacterium]
MQLSPELTSAYNDQIQLEFESSFAYLQMGADFELRSLPGMASWMRLQSGEEHGHAMKFIQFVLDRGAKLELKAISAPAPTPDTVVASFEVALHHEQRVTKAIHDLYSKALDNHDYASLPLLQWFVNEQVEEESTVSTILDRLKMVGDDRTGLLFLDRELGARTGAAAASPAEGETASA